MQTLTDITISQFLGDPVLDAIKWYVLAMFCMSIIVFLAKTLQSITASTIVKNVSNGIRDELYDKVLRKDIGWFDMRENNSGVIGNMLN